MMKRGVCVDDRKKQLYSLFENTDEDKKQFALDTIDEYLFFLDRMTELKKLPYIRVSKSNPERQSCRDVRNVLPHRMVVGQPPISKPLLKSEPFPADTSAFVNSGSKPE